MNTYTTAEHADTWLRTRPTAAPPRADYGLTAAHYSMLAATEREGRLRAERRARRWRSLCLAALGLALYAAGVATPHTWALAAGVALVAVAVATHHTEGQR